MHTTENFGLSQFDATDIFNPMTVNNENAQKIDAQMKLNKDASLGIATELVSQGVHALTRLSDYETCNFFKFTATSNYEAGETFVVDGVQVQAKTVAGSNLASGAYIIGSTVLCELRDALLTIFVPGAQTADDSLALNGHPDTYFGTAEDVAAAQATATAAGNLADQNRADIVQIKSNLTNNKLDDKSYVGSDAMDYFRLVKIGNIVFVNFRKMESTSPNGKITIKELPIELIPKNEQEFVFVIHGNSFTPGGIVKNDGYLYSVAGDSRTAISAGFFYFLD